jgi:hypothetical protein
MELKGIILEEDGAVDGNGVNGGGSSNGNSIAMTVNGGREGELLLEKTKSAEMEGKPINLSGVIWTSDTHAERGKNSDLNGWNKLNSIWLFCLGYIGSSVLHKCCCWQLSSISNPSYGWCSLAAAKTFVLPMLLWREFLLIRSRSAIIVEGGPERGEMEEEIGNVCLEWHKLTFQLSDVSLIKQVPFISWPPGR